MPTRCSVRWLPMKPPAPVTRTGPSFQRFMVDLLSVGGVRSGGGAGKRPSNVVEAVGQGLLDGDPGSPAGGAPEPGGVAPGDLRVLRARAPRDRPEGDGDGRRRREHPCDLPDAVAGA